MGELEEPANLTRDLAQDGGRRREGCAGADAALAVEHNARHLPAVCTGKSAAGGRKTEPLTELNL